MKQKTRTNIFAAAKKYATFIFLMILILNANAQRSGLNIAIATTANIAGGKGGIQQTTATLHKEVVKDVPIPVDGKPFEFNDKSGTPEKKAVSKPKEIAPPVVKTSATVYDIAGNAASDQYTSLQANFIFTFSNINRSVISSLSEIIELYKLEKGTSTRSFCIPAGSCTAVNIAIQISNNASEDIRIPVNRGSYGNPILHHITIPSGYLSPGEYAFIDKSSLKTDGTALVCFAFRVI